MPEDTTELWQELRRLDARATAQERALDRHLGQCEERHKEIVRRQEESTRDRSQLRLDIAQAAAETRRAIESGRDRHAGLGWAIAGATATGLLTLGLKVMKVI